jgi:hypothetical protein
MLTNPYLNLCFGLICGAIAVAFTTPIPQTNGGCSTYSVENRKAVAYVLRPPETKLETCVPVPTPKCEPVAAPEPEKVEAPVEEKSPRRHRRHYRVRRYWK